MPLSDVIRMRFHRSIGLFDALITALPEAALEAKLPGIRSNTIGAQLWCVVGARESYARALEAGTWSGFSCSLTSEASRQTVAVQASLAGSGALVMAALQELESFDDQRNRLVVDLLEHEAAHQGQLIRYLYGLGLPIPGSWKDRYTLD